MDPPILRGLGLARLQGCRFDDCDELARALLDDESHDAIARTEGLYLLGVSAFWRGDLAMGRRYRMKHRESDEADSYIMGCWTAVTG